MGIGCYLRGQARVRERDGKNCKAGRHALGHKVTLVWILEEEKERHVWKRMIETAISGKRKKGRPKKGRTGLVKQDVDMIGSRERDEVDLVLRRRFSRGCDPE